MKTTLFLLLLLLGSCLNCRLATAQNLALGKPATASSQLQPAAAAVDGNGDTRWESAHSDPQDFTVDLGSVQPIDRVRITWENAYGKNFTVQVSGNGSTWATVATTTNNATTVNEYAHLATSGRYVKLVGTARATDYGYSIYELEVFNYSNDASGNLGLGRPAYASSVQGGFPPGQAFDGDNVTRWGSDFLDNQYLYVDLGRSTNLTRVNLVWETAYGRDFTVDVSPDASTWTTVYTAASNTLHVNELNVSGTGRYVRMRGITRATGYGFSLYEMQVYGTYVAVMPLPVELSSFTATAANQAVDLAWATASERDNRGFEVQRSADGREFTRLGWVAGAGSSPAAHRYAYRDAAPLPGTAYYRLLQRDADGTATYSPVRAVTSAAAPAAARLVAFPNPAREQVTITWPATENAVTTWSLGNALGQVLRRETAPAAGRLVLDLRPYPAGTYYLTVQAGGQVLGRRPVVKAE